MSAASLAASPNRRLAAVQCQHICEEGAIHEYAPSLLCLRKRALRNSLCGNANEIAAAELGAALLWHEAHRVVQVEHPANQLREGLWIL